jgi:uncharacterized protein YdeI (YjbR/CyaY-like superfamily)
MATSLSSSSGPEAMNPKIDACFSEAPKWRKEMEKLRGLALQCGLTEELKWGKPSYSYQGSNIVIIQEFKESCALLFCKGALLKDPKGILEKPGEHSYETRRIRFTQVREIVALKPVLKAYIREAVAAAKAGLKVHFKRKPEPIPAELQRKLDDIPALRVAFAALTPGRQRGYLLYFSAAKQAATREARVEKYRKQILQGRGIHD